MATLSQIQDAMGKAEKAGDQEAVAYFANAIRERTSSSSMSGRMALSNQEFYRNLEGKRPKKKTSAFGNLRKGLGAGFVNTLESAALGLATPLEEETELKARAKIQSIADKLEPEGGDKESVLYNIGSGLGSIGATGLATVGGGLLAGPAGAIAAGTTAGVSTQVGEASERARAEGVSEEVRREAITNPLIIGAGALETLPFLKAVGKFSPNAQKKLGSIFNPEEVKGLTKRAKSAAATAGVEGLQELAQNTAQNLVEQGYDLDQELGEGALQSAGYGSATGFIFQLLVDLLPGKSRAPTPAPPPERNIGGQTLDPARTDEEVEGEAISEEDIIREQAALFDEQGQGELFPQTTVQRAANEQGVEAANRQVEKDAEEKKRDDADTPEQAVQQELFEDEEIEKLEADEQENVRKAVEKGDKLTAKEFNELSTNEQKLVLDTLYGKAKNAEEVKKIRNTFEIEVAESDAAVAEAQKDNTTDRRKKILDKVFNDNPTVRNYNAMRNKYQTALKDEGLTDSTATDAEFETIVKEVNIIRKNQQVTGEQDAKPSGRPTEPASTGRGASVQADSEGVGGGSPAPIQNTSQDATPKAGAVEATDTGVDTLDTRTGGEPDTLTRKERVDAQLQAQEESKTKRKNRKERQAQAKEATTKTKTKTKKPKQPKLQTGEAQLNLKPAGVNLKPIDPANLKPYTGFLKGVKGKVVEEPAPKKVRAKQGEAIADPVGRLEETRKTGYIDQVPASPTTQTDTDAVAKTKDKNVQAYFGGRDPIDGVIDAIYDVGLGTSALKAPSAKDLEASGDPRWRLLGEQDTDVDVKEFFKGRSKANATKVLAWARANMSPEFVAEMDKTAKKINRDLKEKPTISKTQQDKDAQAARERKQELEAKSDILKRQTDESALDKQALRRLEKARTAQQESDFAGDVIDAYGEVQQDTNDAFSDLGINTDNVSEKLNTSNEAITNPLSREVVDALRAGNIKDALLQLSKDKSLPPILRTVAKYLSTVVGDTKVFIADGSVRNPLYKAFTAKSKLHEQRGEGKLEGMFVDAIGDVKNTIVLAPEGLTPQSFLHEMVHAATVATIEGKPNSAVVKQLNTLFKQVKKSLPSAYGATNLKEFVAEAFSNPEFRAALDKINPQGAEISGWKRFVNIIAKAIKVKPPFAGQDSILSEADVLIVKILKPSVDGANTTPTMSEFLSMKGGVDKLSAAISKVTGDKPMTGRDRSQFGDKALDFLGDIPNNVREGFMGFLPSLSIGDIATKLNKGLGDLAFKLHDAMLEQRADIRQSDQDVQATAVKFKRWADNKSNAVIKTFNDVVYKTTTMQIDVAKKTREDYKGKTVVDKEGRTRDAQEVYDEIKAQWDTLRANGGQKIYNDMRQAYKNQFEKLRQVIFNDIDATNKNDAEAKDAKKKVKDILIQKLFNSAELEVYFPLLREGEHKLVYYTSPEGTDAQVPQIEMFTTRQAMKRRIKELEGDPQVIKDKKKVKYVSSQTGQLKLNENKDMIPPTSFVRQILTQLDVAGVDKDIQDTIVELYITSLPESAYAKALQKRKGTAGYIEDAMYTFNAKAYDLGRQVARLKNASKLRTLRGDLDDYVTTEIENDRIKPEDREKFDSIVRELNLRSDFARNPTTEFQAWSQGANRLAFMYTIGFNASSALVNASQIPLFVLPYLSADYGMPESITALNNSRKIITASNSLRTKDGKKLGKSLKRTDLTGEEVSFEGKPSLENYFVARFDEEQNRHIFELRDDLQFPNKEMEQMIKDLQELVQLAADRNQLDQSYLSTELNVDQSGRTKTMGDKFTQLGAWGFHNIENYNRQVTLATSYQLEIGKMRKDKGRTELTKEEKQQAAETALYKTQQTNGGAVTETGARHAQNDLGRVALMYKNYGIQMYYTMFKSAKNMFDGTLPKEERTAALKQLIGVHLTAMLFAGVQGLPLYGALKVVANTFFKDDEEEDWDTYVRTMVGEGMYKGAITTATGLDVSKRVALGQLLFQTNRYNVDASMEENIFFYLGGPAWSTALGIERGIKDISRKNYERGIESMVPTAFRNAYKGLFRYNREGALTRRGDPIYTDFTFGELAGQVLGFAPASYTINQEQNMISKGIERNIGEKRSDLMRDYYIAARNGDWGKVEDVKEDIIKFNERHAPKYGNKVAISADSINRSMRRHMQQSLIMEKYNGVSLNPMLRKGLEEQRAQWDNGWELF